MASVQHCEVLENSVICRKLHAPCVPKRSGGDYAGTLLKPSVMFQPHTSDRLPTDFCCNLQVGRAEV